MAMRMESSMDEMGEESRPGHVRFAENNEEVPRYQRPSRRRSSRSQGRPPVYDIDEDEYYNDELAEWANRRQSRRRGYLQPDIGDRFTESPPPIEAPDEPAPSPWIRRAPGRRRSSGHRNPARPFARRRRPSPRESESKSGSGSDTSDAGETWQDTDMWHRPQRGRIYRPLSVASDDWNPYDKFDFTLPSHSVAESSRDGDSDGESPDSEGKTPKLEEEPSVKMAKGSKATAIHASQYTGNAELGGTHSVTLKVLHDPKRQRRALFRWLHIHQKVMNLEDFWTEVSRISGLSDVEMRAMKRLRADVQRNCVKSRYNPKGAKVGYLDTRAFEVPLKLMSKTQGTDEAKPRGSARWICIPYFCLEPYSEALAVSNLGLFPTQTLLQTQYSRNTVQRDMEQAVRQLGTAKREECFHVAQLWCLVIENSLLVTCGTMTQSELQSDSIKINEEPSRDATAASSRGSILVSYGESVTWSFAVGECPTWFAFISKFQAFWPEFVEFRRNDKPISAEDWPKILRWASNPQTIVKIEIKSREAGTPFLAKGKPKGIDDKDLHVLALVSGDGKTATSENLRLYLAAAERFLTQETSFANRKAFKCSSESTRADALNYVVELASRVEGNGSDSVRKGYEDRIDIFNAADIVYGFFLPKDFEDVTSRKFWGAIRKMLTLWDLERESDKSGLESRVSEIRTSLRELTQDIQAFQTIMSHASEEDRRKIKAPRECFTSWLYLVMSVIHMAANRVQSSSDLPLAKSWATRGMGKIVHRLSSVDLLEKATILPLEILSLLTFRLLRDQVGKADDICETYSQYLNSLEVSITSKPSDRSYQHRIDLVQQEMTAIKRVLAKQRGIINTIRSSLTATSTTEVLIQSREEAMVRRNRERDYASHQYRPPTRGYDVGMWRNDRRNYYEAPTIRPTDDYMNMEDEFVNDLATASKLSPTDAGGLRQLLFTECSRLIEQREFEFRRYSEYASDLERAISYKMEFTKDRQENAIFAFTLVTIVFLPMSAVSSIFGMNTKDVRDMEANQWLYWAVALPVTFAVIVAGLWGMNELGNIVRWFLRKPRRPAAGSGGMAMPPAGPPAPPGPSDPVPVPVPIEWVPASRLNRQGQGYYGTGWQAPPQSVRAARTVRAARY